MNEIYKSRFSDAIARTARLGFDLPNEELTKLRLNAALFFNYENKEGLLQHLSRVLGNLRDQIEGDNGIHMSLAAKSAIEEYLGVPAIFTWGAMEHKGAHVFKCEQEEIMSLFNHILPKPGKINIHAWLTLPSFEVIDLFYLDYFSRQKDKVSSPEKTFDYIFGDVKDVFGSQQIVYSPMMIGSDSLIKLSQVFETGQTIS